MLRDDMRPVIRVIALKLLAFSVHSGAFRRAPRAYLIACWWYLRGKRLRARNQFAPLLGASSGAFQLWRLRNAARPAPIGGGYVPIVALIDAHGGGSVEATLQSLDAAGIAAIVVDGPHARDGAGLVERLPGPLQDIWLMPLYAGDRVARGAAAAYVGAIADAEPDAALIYADDDIVDPNGHSHTRPHFKPAWNAELFCHFDYLSGSCILRARTTEIGAVEGGADWVARLVHAVADRTHPVRLTEILHHRQRRPRKTPIAPLTIVRDALPPVTVIVPTRNRADLLAVCLDGLAATQYPGFDTIVVDNGSDEPEALALLAQIDGRSCRVLRHAGPFNFSAINNRAVAEADGRMICMLNNDVEIAQRDWLAILATQAGRSDVGAVGPRLLYPDGRIQHAGVVLGVGGGAAHAHRLQNPEEEGYFWRHALPQFTSAVTAACLVVLRERFLEVGGLDAQAFAVAFNDVDLCMKLNARGWRSLYEPRATLVHHESLSRGFDKDPVGAARLARELAALKSRWATDHRSDPFHHPDLSRFSEQFVVGL